MIELLEHNVETYQNLCKEMEKHNKVALIQATGTGKSYIISKYIEEHCHNALILVPANAIGDQWKKLLPNTEVKTYQAMAKGIEGEYDLIVADEMHHLGSDVWGQKFIEYFMQNPEQKVIGATATEIRYLDNARDMVEEIFDGVAVRGLDLATAIDKGILPTFKYIVAQYGSEQDFDEYREKVNNIEDSQQRKNLSRRLEMCIQNRISIKTAMYENLSMAKHNIIVFLNGICEIGEAIEMFTEMFPDSDCNYVSSKRLNKENEISISRFQESEKQISILLAIDMLNEGVHIDGVDTVVMFRGTESLRIYLQQIGRALSAKNVNIPTIFDFANNYKETKLRINEELKNSDGIYKVIEHVNSTLPRDKKIIINSYVKETQVVLDEINQFFSHRSVLTDDEKATIIEKAELGWDAEQIASELGKNEWSIKYFARKNGIQISQKENPYSIPQEQIDFIDRASSEYTKTQLIDLFRQKFGDEFPAVKRTLLYSNQSNNGKTDASSRVRSILLKLNKKTKSRVGYNARKVQQINTQTNEVVCEFPSISCAEKHFGNTGGQKIYNCLAMGDYADGRPRTAYGFAWKYANE